MTFRNKEKTWFSIDEINSSGYYVASYRYFGEPEAPDLVLHVTVSGGSIKKIKDRLNEIDLTIKSCKDKSFFGPLPDIS